MGSLRDPAQAASNAAELARAKLNASQAVTRTKARRSRERRLKGDLAARKALAADFAAVSDVEARRAQS